MKTSRCIYLSRGGTHHAVDIDGHTLCGLRRPQPLVVKWGTEDPIVLRSYWVNDEDFCTKCRRLLESGGFGSIPADWVYWPQSWLIIKKEKNHFPVV